MSQEKDLNERVIAAITEANERAAAALDEANRAMIAEAIEQGTLFDNVSGAENPNPVRKSSVSQEALEDDLGRRYMDELAIVQARILAEQAGHYNLPAKIDPDLVTTFNKKEAKRLASEFKGKKKDVRLGKRTLIDAIRQGKDPTKGDIGHRGKGIMGKGPIRRSPPKSSIHLTFPALGMYCWYLAEVESDILSALEELLWEDDTFEFDYTDADGKPVTVNPTTFIQSIYKLYVSKDTRNNSQRRIAIASDNRFEILAEIGYALLAPYVFSKKQAKKRNAGFDALNRQFGRKDGANALFQERCAATSDSALSRFLEIAIQDSRKLPSGFHTHFAIQSILEFANKTLKTSHKAQGTDYRTTMTNFFETASGDIRINLHNETAIIARIAYIEAALKVNNDYTPDEARLLHEFFNHIQDLANYVASAEIKAYFIAVCDKLQLPKLTEVGETADAEVVRPRKKTRFDMLYETPTKMLVRLRL